MPDDPRASNTANPMESEPSSAQAAGRASEEDVAATGAAAETPGPASPPEEQMADEEAVARARDGDHEAFRVLVERYQGRAFRLALRILRDEEQARDAVQDAFLKVYGALHKFEGRSSFYTWMYRLVFNLCLDIKRRDRSSRHVELPQDGLPAGALGVEDGGAAAISAARESAREAAAPARDLERSELREQLASAIASLPDDARQTLLLREVEGLSYAEIAQALEIPKGTVMSRLYYARKKVKESLVAAGVTLSGGQS